MVRWLIIAALVAGGCGDDPHDPNFGGTCVPKSTNLGVDCTIHNKAKKPHRACITVRLVREGKIPMASRRTCTRAIQPDERFTLSPEFNEGFDRCVVENRWACTIEIVENSRTMGENLPAER
jgi:hypothetical protein